LNLELRNAGTEFPEQIKQNGGRKKGAESAKVKGRFLSSGRPPRLPDRRIGGLRN
jgi:hypothetical protein